MPSTFLSFSSGDYRTDQPKLDGEHITDVKIGPVKGEANLALLEGGTVFFGEFPGIHTFSPSLVLASISQVRTRGISFLVPMRVPGYTPPNDTVHFDVVISSEANAVESGEPDYELVLARYRSTEGGYFYLELSSLYELPTAGADISFTSTQSGRIVKLFVTNVGIDATYEIFAYWRPMFYSGGSFTGYGEWNGSEIRFPKSIPSNTGTETSGNQIITMNPGLMVWAAGQNAHFEVYAGYESDVSTYTSGGELLHRDSSLVWSGFKYFDGTEVLDVPSTGVPYAYVSQSKFLVTNTLPSDRPIVVHYRAKTSGGSTSWVAELAFPSDFFETGGQTFHPPLTVTIPENTYSEYYHAQVIIGTDPDLADYFAGGDTSLEYPDLSYGGLEDFGYSRMSADSSRFWYFHNGVMTNPAPYHAMPNTKDVVLTYRPENSYSGDRRLYVFWRFLYSVGFSSSSSSSSGSSSFSSSSSNSQSNSSSSYSSG